MCGRGLQRLLQHAKETRMKLPTAVTAVDAGFFWRAVERRKATVEEAEGPMGREASEASRERWGVGARMREGDRMRCSGRVDRQGSRVNLPSYATLQAPGLPYTSGPYLGRAAVTLSLLRGGCDGRIRAVRSGRWWTRVGGEGGVASAVAWPAQFHAVSEPASDGCWARATERGQRRWVRRCVWRRP